jgi:CheY-like chemotaxis protein
MAELSIQDDGVGISADVLGRLFTPFTQAPQSLERTRGGLGLGLAMAKGLIELHGGSVEARSSGAGRGSTFIVRLPLAGAPASEASSTVRTTAEFRRLLIVDDNHDAADTLRDLLALEGHEGHVAYDGPTALALARELHPEVVLCDIGLPDMDGYEVARRMRADRALRSAHLVALTGYASAEDRRRSLAAGFDRHIAKPPDPDELARILAQAPRLPLP